jgi:hypothetical protein
VKQGQGEQVKANNISPKDVRFGTKKPCVKHVGFCNFRSNLNGF